MTAQRMSFWNIAFVVVLVGLAAPAAMYHLSQGRNAQALLAVTGALLGVAIVVIEGLRGSAPAAAPAVELVGAVAAPAGPLTIKAVRTHGVCPEGFRVGSFWTVDQEGRLAPPLCQPAVAALSPLLQGLGSTLARQTACRCPRGDQSVTFVVMR